jgi:ADP-ribose pyrophosphatase YjhB (NUDIX family)
MIFAEHSVWKAAFIFASVVALVEALSCKYVDDNASMPAAGTCALLFALGFSKSDLLAALLLTLVLVFWMLSANSAFTHRVAVAAIVVKDRQVLMAKRRHKPVIWAPPGGHLRRGEHPEVGVIREVLEECDVKVEPVRPVSLYMGEHKGELLLGVSIACRYIDGDPRPSSEEHTECRWVDPHTFSPGPFQIEGVYVLGSSQDYVEAVRVAAQAKSRGV